MSVEQGRCKLRIYLSSPKGEGGFFSRDRSYGNLHK
jgi:hypothetical protein